MNIPDTAPHAGPFTLNVKVPGRAALQLPCSDLSMARRLVAQCRAAVSAAGGSLRLLDAHDVEVWRDE